jgi:hypothetical protein
MNPAPARRSTRHSPLWTWLHSFVHLVGLAGVLTVAVGLVLAHAAGMLPTQQLVDAADACLQGKGPQAWGHLRAATDGFATAMGSSEYKTVVGQVVLAGAAAVLLYLLIEAIVAVTLVAGRRSALGLSAAVQIGLAALLFLCVNVWSFRNPARYDWTREQQFTLPEDVVSRLQKLDRSSEGAGGEKADRRTTVIVYQRHKTFGSLSDKPDRYDYAAERKVVEKVKDLADELRRLGKQLRVEVLDVEAEDYKDHLTALTQGEPRLQQAIEAAPENSLFFTARGANGRLYVQRLSFNDFYLLDKKASEEDNGGKGNLVLRSQGMEPFVRRILNLEERPPRVGIAVIHDVLSSEGLGDMSLAGLRAVLQTHGFEVRDIVLKKWSERGTPPETAATTADESRLARLDEREALRERNLRGLEQLRTRLVKQIDTLTRAITDEKTRDQLTRDLADQLGDRKVTPELAESLADQSRQALEELDEAIKNLGQRLEEVRKEKKSLNVPQLREQQRMTDVRAKLDRLLADCDVLLVPRMTLGNTANPYENIPARVYRLDDSQVDAIKDFMKSGKPVLACLGPSNEAEATPDADRPEPLEKALDELGVHLGKQTVLFDEEMEAFADRRAGQVIAGTNVKVPPVLFSWRPGEGRPVGSPLPPDRSNPLRESLSLTARSLGGGQALDVRIRHPRPIYFVPSRKGLLAFDPDFLMTAPQSWNEDQPFPTESYIPQFQRIEPSTGERKKDDKKGDPLELRRRGPFPIGVAVQTPLPQKWYDSDSATPETVRVAVIGQGGFFTGRDLSPAKEKLMVYTLNWLLGRDDYLPHAGQTWSYPRVNLPDDTEEGKLWRWGVFGLPLLSAALGILVWLVRRIH